MYSVRTCELVQTKFKIYLKNLIWKKVVIIADYLTFETMHLIIRKTYENLKGCAHVHGSISDNSQKVEATQVSI
jgi:hypothetical protein